jgi:hypothetical protein
MRILALRKFGPREKMPPAPRHQPLPTNHSPPRMPRHRLLIVAAALAALALAVPWPGWFTHRATLVAAQPAADRPDRSEFRSFLDQFGTELGPKYFAGDMSLPAAKEEYILHLKQEVGRLKASRALGTQASPPAEQTAAAESPLPAAARGFARSASPVGDAPQIIGPSRVVPYTLVRQSVDRPGLWRVTGPGQADKAVGGGGLTCTWTAPPGTYRVEVACLVIDWDARTWSQTEASTEVVIAASDPPQPPSPIDPPAPGGKWQLLLLQRSSQLDNLSDGQQTILAGRKFREQLAQAGHRLLGVYDPAAAPDAPAEFAPWFAAGKSAELPAVLYSPLGGGAIRVARLPADGPSLLEFLSCAK